MYFIMQFSKQGSSSFTPYQGPKSLSHENEAISDFNKLSINSPRSNASQYVPNIPPYEYDSFTMRGSRKRKGSGSFQWKESSIYGNTFLRKSLMGKSSLFRDNDEFALNELEYLHMRHEELSEKSCPVRNEQSHFEKHHGFQHEEQNFVKQKSKKRFEKTKNLLRTIGSNLHKYIKYNKKAKQVVLQYATQLYPDLQKGQLFYQEFKQWLSTFSMQNFQEYQRAWLIQSKYRSIYRQLCFKYYREEAYCDIQKSRLTIKQTACQYLYQFIEGLFDPTSFTQFKNETHLF